MLWPCPSTCWSDVRDGRLFRSDDCFERIIDRAINVRFCRSIGSCRLCQPSIPWANTSGRYSGRISDRIGQIRAVIIIYSAIIFAFILLVSVNRVGLRHLGSSPGPCRRRWASSPINTRITLVRRIRASITASFIGFRAPHLSPESDCVIGCRERRWLHESLLCRDCRRPVGPGFVSCLCKKKNWPSLQRKLFKRLHWIARVEERSSPQRGLFSEWKELWHTISE